MRGTTECYVCGLSGPHGENEHRRQGLFPRTRWCREAETFERYWDGLTTEQREWLTLRANQLGVDVRDAAVRVGAPAPTKEEA